MTHSITPRDDCDGIMSIFLQKGLFFYTCWSLSEVAFRRLCQACYRSFLQLAVVPY